ncbi:glycosyltransferase family 39 protein [Fischerella sp. JS2]|uniref:ArnT family glycosyltransferase n=1 Tax=Fischerella sp. JS2 TaxID=2597771 RepID=UPI0028E7B9E6|nr:glycosyltransferase family 39 protein [Fischerella sp. JS2]
MKLIFTRAIEYWLINPGKRPFLALTSSVIWLLVIAWVAFFWHLGSIGLIDETEPLFAEASRQMIVTGDWITPYFNGETRFDKPILIYWCQALAYLIFGVNELAVRIPSALAALGLICLLFWTLQSVQITPQRQPLTAPLGAAIMAFNPETVVWARTGVSDMLLTSCMASALLCFFLGYAQPLKPAVQARWFLACYVLVALAVLTKGPVGIVIPGIIIGTFLLYLGNWRSVLREMRLFWGFLIIVAIALPWYVLVTLRNGSAFINSFFMYHNIERFTSVVNNHSAPWYFYFLVVLLGFAPWSIYLPATMVESRFWQRKYWCEQERSSQLSLFALFWFFCIFGFFTIAVTKLPSYVLPLMPAAAILVTLLWNNELDSKFLYCSSWVNVAFLWISSVATTFLPLFLNHDPSMPYVSLIIRNSNIPRVGVVIWGIAAVLGIVGLLRHQWRWLLGINLLAFIVFLIFVITPTMLVMDYDRQLPLRQLSAIVVRVQQPHEELLMLGFKKPSVTFYTHRHVTYISQSEKAVKYIENEIVTKPHPSTVLIISEIEMLQRMKLQPFEYKNIAQAGAYELVRVVKKN